MDIFKCALQHLVGDFARMLYGAVHNLFYVASRIHRCPQNRIATLSMQRFWATDGNRKCAVFVFNFSSHYHINVVKSLFASRYDQFENLRETTVLACEMFTSGVRPWLKNVACLSSLMSDARPQHRELHAMNIPVLYLRPGRCQLQMWKCLWRIFVLTGSCNGNGSREIFPILPQQAYEH